MSYELSSSAQEQDLASPSAAKPQLAPHQISAIEEKQAARKLSRAQIESSENRKSDLATLVMDHWDEEGSQNKCFGVDVTSDMIPDKIVDCLLRIEADYDLNLLTSLQSGELSLQDVGDFLASEIDTQQTETRLQNEQQKTTFQQEQADKASTTATQYAERVQALRASGISSAEIISVLINDEATPAPERAKLEAIQRTLQQLSGIGGTPKAKQFFVDTVNQHHIDFTASEPQQIYGSLLSHIDAGLASGAISQSDVDAARVILGVQPKRKTDSYKVPTNPSEMARNLRDRRTVKSEIPVIDPATGEPMLDDQGNVIYETIMEEDNTPIPIDHPNLEIYLLPEPGSNAYYVHILSQSRLPLVEKVNADSFVMGGMSEINYLVANADLEQQGFTDMFGPQFTSNEVRRRNYERFMDATGMDPDFGGLWTTEHSDRVRKLMQTLHPNGDLGRDDVDLKNWKQWTAKAGLYDLESDQWIYEGLKSWRDRMVFDDVGKDGETLIHSDRID